MKTVKKPTLHIYEDVIYEMELLMNCTTSDAQGIAMLYEDDIEEAILMGESAKAIAEDIERKSTVNA